MANPSEDSRLLETPTRDLTSSVATSHVSTAEDVDGWRKPGSRRVNVNMMKRNMSVAKGFIDISLLTANSSQLKHLLILGDPSDKLYYVVLTGLVLSLILQVATGILLILKERFDLDVLEHQASAEFYNDLTLGFVFATLALNVFISSLGVSVMQRHPYQTGHPLKQDTGDGQSGNWNSLSPRVAPTNISFRPDTPITF